MQIVEAHRPESNWPVSTCNSGEMTCFRCPDEDADGLLGMVSDPLVTAFFTEKSELVWTVTHWSRPFTKTNWGCLEGSQEHMLCVGPIPLKPACATDVDGGVAQRRALSCSAPGYRSTLSDSLTTTAHVLARSVHRAQEGMLVCSQVQHMCELEPGHHDMDVMK